MGDALLPALSALPTIAMQALPIGWRGGVRQRSSGAARTLARVARQQLAAVLERPVRLVSGVVERRWRPRHLLATLDVHLLAAMLALRRAASLRWRFSRVIRTCRAGA